MFIFFDFGHYIGRGRRSKIGGGDKLFTSWKELLARSERVSSQVGESIIPGRKEYQGRRIKLRCPPKVLTDTLHPSLPSIFSG